MEKEPKSIYIIKYIEKIYIQNVLFLITKNMFIITFNFLNYYFFRLLNKYFHNLKYNLKITILIKFGYLCINELIDFNNSII